MWCVLYIYICPRRDTIYSSRAAQQCHMEKFGWLVEVSAFLGVGLKRAHSFGHAIWYGNGRSVLQCGGRILNYSFSFQHDIKGYWSCFSKLIRRKRELLVSVSPYLRSNKKWNLLACFSFHWLSDCSFSGAGHPHSRILHLYVMRKKDFDKLMIVLSSWTC